MPTYRSPTSARHLDRMLYEDFARNYVVGITVSLPESLGLCCMIGFLMRHSTRASQISPKRAELGR